MRHTWVYICLFASPDIRCAELQSIPCASLAMISCQLPGPHLIVDDWKICKVLLHWVILANQVREPIRTSKRRLISVAYCDYMPRWMLM